MANATKKSLRQKRYRSLGLAAVVSLVPASLLTKVSLFDAASAHTVAAAASTVKSSTPTTKPKTTVTTKKVTKKKVTKKKVVVKKKVVAKPVAKPVFPAVGQVPADTTAVGEFRVVCYSGGTRTYSGQPVGTNVVAVDKTVIPIKTKIYIDGVGWRTALDTGSAVKGKILDIWMPTNSDCRAWGSRNHSVFVQTGVVLPGMEDGVVDPSSSAAVPAQSGLAPTPQPSTPTVTMAPDVENPLGDPPG